ncbi:phage portal protein [Chelativorans sp. SCAU2101]|uniref:Phage portal protein n=1 Tax=Chelativorans petroleitrophicus TaxID=2975484 RepID=A0A9X3B0S7_9HYPH|nr:phage portal protein [Chelativorans petroleitrophicus]MCT8992044.1 phage portal protein [Chelativorans petroleitrophicus]
MGIIDRFLGRRETRAAPTSWDLLGQLGFPTLTGGLVSPAVVEGNAAAFSAITIISEAVAMLPLLVYRKEAGGVREAEASHPVARLFTEAPNELQTPAEFIATMQANCLLHGYAVAEIERNGNGHPAAIWPIHPGQVSLERIPGTRRIRFEVSDEVGTRRLLPGEVFILRDRWDDPFTPRSRLDRAREALGGAVATERFAAATWRNGARLSGIVTHPEQIGPEAAKTLRESLQALYGGSENAGKIGVLEEGMQWKEVSATPHDAELSEARRLAVLEVARIFNIPAPLLNELSNANYSNVVEMRRQFAAGTVQPWLVRWEQAIMRDLFSEAGRRSHEVEFDTDLLVRADILTRFQAYRIGREVGVYSANDLRRFENLNPRTDAEADAYLSPLNMNREQTGAPKE